MSGDRGIDEDLDPDDGLLEDWAVRNIVTTLVPLLIAMSVLQMVSGTVLESFEEELLENPSLLVLVPVMIGTAGNLGSIMCARLSTQLHLGTLEFSPANPGIRANVGAVLGLAATVFVLLGIASWAIGALLGGTLGLGTLLVITMVSGMLLAVWVVIVSTVSVYVSYQLGYDPDDTTIPVVTNVCDITGVLILFAVVWVVL
ncbi:magnesium transporter [Halopiger xanaduensis]|uniref:MgtE integral membrane region n=1 Tax=Halopiger xanaduensis (strain DSM 18323 / JCM 14033 / SH-6) TaxID=797210 RepID=F8D4P3_HALXS|nr:magnesium transporter [Halopiger xanaduensis]AEH36379.1 MgtE integral membrane region [Halopiger xanaduensis SH-6]